jgi:hypothetical protein
MVTSIYRWPNFKIYFIPLSNIIKRCTVRPDNVSCLQKFQHFWRIFCYLFFESGSTEATKIKKILQRYVIYISDQITVPSLNIETGNRRLNIGEWYVFARRKGLKIYFFSTNSLNYVKYVITIWWNRHRRFQCKENMTNRTHFPCDGCI